MHRQPWQPFRTRLSETLAARACASSLGVESPRLAPQANTSPLESCPLPEALPHAIARWTCQPPRPERNTPAVPAASRASHVKSDSPSVVQLLGCPVRISPSRKNSAVHACWRFLPGVCCVSTALTRGAAEPTSHSWQWSELDGREI
jgi:hypothetical protein